MTEPLATAADIKAMAEKKPDSGWDEEKGELRLGDVIYRPRKHVSRAQEKAIAQLERERENARLQATVIRIEAKTTPTEREIIEADEARDAMLDTIFHKLTMLFFDPDGQPPAITDIEAHIGSVEAARAMVWAMADPTTRKKTEATSD